MTDISRARLAKAAAAAITAVALGGGCGEGPTTPSAMLASVALGAANAVGGTAVQGTVTLSSAAGSGGAAVTLSSNHAAATVPAAVTVPSGGTSATFTVMTTPVLTATPVTISGTFGGATRTTTVNLTPPALAAVFTVASATNVADRCNLNVGGQTLDCTFNGSQSIGPVQTWEWRYSIAANQITVPASANPTLTTPSTNGCGLFTGQTGGGPNTQLQMVVRLIVRDASGNTSEAVNQNVAVQPRSGACGF